VLDLEKHMIAGEPRQLKPEVPDATRSCPTSSSARSWRTSCARVGDDITIVAPLSNIDFETWRSKAAAPRTRRFRVSGIFYSGFDEYDRRLMYTSLAQTQALKDNGDRVMGVELKVETSIGRPRSPPSSATSSVSRRSRSRTGTSSTTTCSRR
jgi:hypothetical protein